MHANNSDHQTSVFSFSRSSSSDPIENKRHPPWAWSRHWTHRRGRQAVGGLPEHRRPPELELRPRRQRHPACLEVDVGSMSSQQTHQSTNPIKLQKAAASLTILLLHLPLVLLLYGSRRRRGGGGGADAGGGAPPAGDDDDTRTGRLPVVDSRGAGAAAQAAAGGERGHRSVRRRRRP